MAGKKKLNNYSYVLDSEGKPDYVVVDIISPKYGFHQMLIEVDDVPLLADGSVCVSYHAGIKGFYVKQYVNGETVKFHRRLFPDAKPDEDVMHLVSPLDNRRRNLKLGSKSENQRDRKSHREGRLFGAYFNEQAGKWVSQSRLNCKPVYLGLHDSEIQAHLTAMAYESIIKNKGTNK
jgi:hypothetical protein